MASASAQVLAPHPLDVQTLHAMRLANVGSNRTIGFEVSMAAADAEASIGAKRHAYQGQDSNAEDNVLKRPRREENGSVLIKMTPPNKDRGAKQKPVHMVGDVVLDIDVVLADIMEMGAGILAAIDVRIP